jgi:hypothetical protein
MSMPPEGSAAPRQGTTAAERRAQDAGPNAARVRHAKAIDAQTRHAEFLQQEVFELAEMERKVQDAASKMQAYYRGFITRKMHIPKQRNLDWQTYSSNIVKSSAGSCAKTSLRISRHLQSRTGAAR